ncbi:MAG: ATP-binding protein [Candidatus Hydrogenedentes bacterium]|nr:ATP-binding protein [Candidatus Hydrogenedentota bacterium]
MYTPRSLDAFLNKASGLFPVVLVTGARQVGKTTLLRHAAGQIRRYVTLDDPLLLRLAQEEPALFVQRFPPPVLIDEIQYAPGLLPHIKMAADELGKPGLFWLTGSQQFHLMKGVSESLAGRVGTMQLLGLSRRELTGKDVDAAPFLPGAMESKDPGAALTLSALYQLIWRGSYPAVALNPAMEKELFYRSYLQSYLQRDVRDLAQVGDEMAFLRFLRAAAARSAQLLNMADLARDADVAPNTAKRWLSILQTSGIVYLLPPWHSNRTSRLVKTPKLYFLDTGLCTYLTEWSSPETLEAGALSGAILETWVVTELLKSYWHNGRHAPFSFYRDKEQKEIDLLIEQDGVLYPIEIKKSANPSPKAVGSFKTLGKCGVSVGRGALLCLADQLLPLTDSVDIVPVSAL